MGLASLGLDKGDHVAILSENRPEWAFADMAVLALGGADVPIYPSLPAAQVRYILADSEAKAVFVSNATQAAKVAEVRGELEGLKHVIAFEPVAGAMSLDELRTRGREALAQDKDAVRTRAARVSASDLATIIYTSGTTGDPKGVMLTHGNLVSNTLGAAKAHPAAKARLDLPQLPAALPRLRAHGGPQPDAARGRHDRLRRERRARGRQHGRGAAADHVVGAAALREDVRARAREGGEGPEVEAGHLSLGARGRARGLPGAGGAAQPGAAAPAEAGARRAAGVREDQGADRRPARDLHLGRRAALARDRGVLRRRGHPDLRGLRPHRDEPGDHLQPARAPAARQRGAADRGRRGEDRRGRRDPHARAARDAGLLQEARGDARGDRRRGLVPHRRHRPPRSRRLPGDHRPQEGPDRDLGRQEDRAAADREPAEGEPLLQRGGDDRQPPQLRGRARGAELRAARWAGRRSAGSTARARSS